VFQILVEYINRQSWSEAFEAVIPLRKFKPGKKKRKAEALGDGDGHDDEESGESAEEEGGEQDQEQEQKQDALGIEDETRGVGIGMPTGQVQADQQQEGGVAKEVGDEEMAFNA
jgi:hypothetical protein